MDVDLESRLQKLECPFTWNVPEPDNRELIFQQLNNNEDQSDFVINGFCVFILECFERARADEIEIAIRKADECEAELSEYSPIGLFLKNDQYVWERSHDALWHVLLATQAHLSYKNDDLEGAREKIQKMIPTHSLSESNLAALYAIKSRFYQGYGGVSRFCEEAIKFAKEAVRYDDSVPLWHFLLGKSIARHRRNDFPYENPSDEECFALDRAWRDCKKPVIGVMLLQTYQTLMKKRPRGREFSNLKQMILDIIRDIKAYAGNEWYTYWRCAHVCVRLPAGVVPPDEVKGIIDLAFEFSEKAHNKNKKHLWEVSAAYYKFVVKDYKQALEYYVKAAEEGEVTCVYDVLSLNHRLNPSKDLLPLINKYIDYYSHANSGYRISNLLASKASYLLFVKHDVKEAFKIYFDLMNENCSSYQLLNCRPLFSEFPKNYSVYQLLKMELNKAIQTCSNEDDAATYKNYLQILNNYEKSASEN